MMDRDKQITSRIISSIFIIYIVIFFGSVMLFEKNYGNGGMFWSFLAVLFLIAIFGILHATDNLFNTNSSIKPIVKSLVILITEALVLFSCFAITLSLVSFLDEIYLVNEYIFLFGIYLTVIISFLVINGIANKKYKFFATEKNELFKIYNMVNVVTLLTVGLTIYFFALDSFNSNQTIAIFVDKEYTDSKEIDEFITSKMKQDNTVSIEYYIPKNEGHLITKDSVQVYDVVSYENNTEKDNQTNKLIMLIIIYAYYTCILLANSKNSTK